MRWLTRLFAHRVRPGSNAALWMYVRCSRCGEAIRIRADPWTIERSYLVAYLSTIR
jgi:hypothetical protein